MWTHIQFYCRVPMWTNIGATLWSQQGTSVAQWTGRLPGSSCFDRSGLEEFTLTLQKYSNIASLTRSESNGNKLKVSTAKIITNRQQKLALNAASCRGYANKLPITNPTSVKKANVSFVFAASVKWELIPERDIENIRIKISKLRFMVTAKSTV